MKILYVSTISNTINAFMVPHIQMLINQGYSVDIACSVERTINNTLVEQGCNVHNISFSRSPLSFTNYKAYKSLRELIKKEKYDIVHTHTPVASAITRLVCKGIKNTRVFYTAHGFHFYKGAPLKNWMIYYPIEKWLSKYTDTIITINNEDYERAKNKFKAKKIEYIPGVGLDTKKYKHTHIDKKTKREKICVPEDAFLILSIGELNKNKNHEVIIRAIEKLNNPKIHYVICGEGPLKSYLKRLSVELGINKQIHLLGFRTDINEICKISDVFAFPSLREGLGMAALEAMASGLPIITSNVHGIVDYSVDGQTGYTSNPKDVDGFSKKINYLIKDKPLEKKSIDNVEAVLKYDTKNILPLLKRIYQ